MNISDDPKDWFSIDTQFSDPYLTAKNGNMWPWTHLSENDYLFLASRIQIKDILKNTALVDAILFYIGLIGSALTLCTVIRKVKMKDGGLFYTVLSVIACLDGSFLALKLARKEVHHILKNNSAADEFYCYASGIAYSCSLMSDMLTFILTIERYVALQFPIFYRAVPERRKIQIWLGAGSIATVLSLSRLHYAFNTFKVPTVGLESNFLFHLVVDFSDKALPFLLIGLMAPLVCCITKTIYSRFKQKKQTPLYFSHEHKVVRNVLKSISLLICLMIMFFMNQLAYVLYSIVTMMMPTRVLFYSSSYDEVSSYANFFLFYYLVACMSEPLEVVSRSMVFYTYFLCNRSFRADFLHAIACTKITAVGTVSSTSQRQQNVERH